jgi:hypothetical protein
MRSQATADDNAGDYLRDGDYLRPRALTSVGFEEA